MTHPIAPLLKRFFSHYMPVQKGLSENTIRSYRDAIKLLLCYVADTLSQSVDALSVELISEKTVLGFLDAVENTRGCTTGWGPPCSKWVERRRPPWPIKKLSN